MVLRGSITLALAAVLAAIDLAHKAAAEIPWWAYHVRSGAWELLAAGLVVGCVGLTRIPSASVAAAAGILAGGATGNLVSSLRSDEGVPNPIFFRDDKVVIAFNLADIFTLAGIGALMVTLVSTTIRHRAQLLPPRAFASMLWRRLRSR